jgi:hypothetical protein
VFPEYFIRSGLLKRLTGYAANDCAYIWSRIHDSSTSPGLLAMCRIAQWSSLTGVFFFGAGPLSMSSIGLRRVLHPGEFIEARADCRRPI